MHAVMISQSRTAKMWVLTSLERLVPTDARGGVRDKGKYSTVVKRQFLA